MVKEIAAFNLASRKRAIKSLLQLIKKIASENLYTEHQELGKRIPHDSLVIYAALAICIPFFRRWPFVPGLAIISLSICLINTSL